MSSGLRSFFWSQPSSLLIADLRRRVARPGAASTDLKDRPCLVRKSLALSQSVNLLHGPTKMWKLQIAGSAATVIGVFAEYASSAGLT